MLCGVWGVGSVMWGVGCVVWGISGKTRMVVSTCQNRTEACVEETSHTLAISAGKRSEVLRPKARAHKHTHTQTHTRARTHARTLAISAGKRSDKNLRDHGLTMNL